MEKALYQVDGNVIVHDITSWKMKGKYSQLYFAWFVICRLVWWERWASSLSRTGEINSSEGLDLKIIRKPDIFSSLVHGLKNLHMCLNKTISSNELMLLRCQISRINLFEQWSDTLESERTANRPSFLTKLHHQLTVTNDGKHFPRMWLVCSAKRM